MCVDVFKGGHSTLEQNKSLTRKQGSGCPYERSQQDRPFTWRESARLGCALLTLRWTVFEHSQLWRSVRGAPIVYADLPRIATCSPHWLTSTAIFFLNVSTTHMRSFFGASPRRRGVAAMAKWRPFSLRRRGTRPVAPLGMMFVLVLNTCLLRRIWCFRRAAFEIRC